MFHVLEEDEDDAKAGFVFPFFFAAVFAVG